MPYRTLANGGYCYTGDDTPDPPITDPTQNPCNTGPWNTGWWNITFRWENPPGSFNASPYTWQFQNFQGFGYRTYIYNTTNFAWADQRRNEWYAIATSGATNTGFPLRCNSLAVDPDPCSNGNENRLIISGSSTVQGNTDPTQNGPLIFVSATNQSTGETFTPPGTCQSAGERP
jgi:hypothetical protein